MNFFSAASSVVVYLTFSRGKTKGRVGQRPNSFQYFLRKPSRLYSNFCFNYFHFGSEKEYCVKGLFHFVRIQWGIQARQMEKLWNGWKACHPKSVLNQIWKQPGHFFVLLVTEKCLRPRGKWSKQKRENVGKNSHFARDPSSPLWEHPCQKNLRFILCFRALGAFLVFTKMLTFCDKVMWE